MKKESNIILWGLTVFAVLLGFVGVMKPGTVVEKVVDTDGKVISVGGSAGPEHTQRQFFKSGYESSCNRYATSSTATTYTLTATEFDYDNCYIDWTVNVNTTLTTMASTSAPFLGMKKDDTREFWIRNASTTVASTLTLAAGTGIDIQISETTGGDLVIEGLNVAHVTALKKNDTDILLIVDEYKPGD